MGDLYADNIKRIVGIDPNQSGLGSAKKKPAIDGKRGIAFVSAASGSIESKTGAPGSSQLSNTKDGSLATGEKRPNAGKQLVSGGDPSAGISSTSDGVYTGSAIIDGTGDASKVSEPSITESGLSYENNGALKELQVQDCESGKDLNLRFEDNFVPPNEQQDPYGNTISLDWDDAETPPDKPGFELGKYWYSSTGVPYQSPTPFDYGQIATVLESQNYGAGLTGPGIQGSANGSGNYYKFVSHQASGADYLIRLIQVDVNGTEIGIEFTGLMLSEASCSGGELGVAPYCPLTAPKETAWPADDTIKMKFSDGKYQTSEYDEDVPPKWKDPTSSVDFCFDGGTRNGTVEVSKDGGNIIYETAGPGGAIQGIIRVYDSSGGLTAAFDASSGMLGAYRPT